MRQNVQNKKKSLDNDMCSEEMDELRGSEDVCIYTVVHIIKFFALLWLALAINV
jgi:hypothetical protein